MMYVAKIEIIPAVRTERSAIVIEINSLDTQNHGPSFWKINNSLLEDPTYVELIRENVPIWLSEINFCTDYRIVWDWIKYNIRQESISYSKQKAREKREKLKNIEETLTTASQMEVGCLRHPGVSTIGSQLLDGDRSHGWQILATQP